MVTRTALSKKGEGGRWSSTYLALEVTLANGAGASEVPLNPALFSIETTEGLSKIALNSSWSPLGDWSPPQLRPGTRCDPTVAVLADARVTCTLFVSFDGDVAPSRVRYQTPGAAAEANGVASPSADRRTASAAVSPAPCKTCGAVCTALEADPLHCGKCNNDISQIPDTDCVAGVPTCGSSGQTYCPSDPGTGKSPGACVDLQTSAGNCGLCGKRTGWGTCVGGAPSCDAQSIACPGKEACINPLSNENCGACGKRCSVGSCQKLITGYFCSGEADQNAGESCSNACVRKGFDHCDYAYAHYGSGNSYPHPCSDPPVEVVGGAYHCVCVVAPAQ